MFEKIKRAIIRNRIDAARVAAVRAAEAGRTEDYYRHKNRAEDLEDALRGPDQLPEVSELKDAVRVWERYIGPVNESLARQFAEYMTARRALADRCRRMIETQREAYRKRDKLGEACDMTHPTLAAPGARDSIQKNFPVEDIPFQSLSEDLEFFRRIGVMTDKEASAHMNTLFHHR